MPKGVYPHTHIKPKRYPPDMVRQVRALYGNGMTQDEVAAELGVTQKVIWKLMRNHGIATRTAAKRDQRGPKNSAWKGGRTISTAGYVMVQQEGHPRATGPGNYVFEHVLVVEERLGRRLEWFGPGDPRTEIVHHANGDRQDNRPENLVVTTYSEHLEYHRHPMTGENAGAS